MKFLLRTSLVFSALLSLSATAQVVYNPSGKSEYTDFENDTLQLERVVVTGQGGSRLKASHLTSNTEIIGQQQLVRAACCNLGESFTTNPSVDVNYSDAATGAQQIKLLGLSGTYVQMLTENVPNLRGAAIPFGLGYIPGPWMQSIQVSKGASSVRNGYESTTGQINIEYLKPQGVDNFSGNLYYDIDEKIELNLMAGTHLLGNLLGDEYGQSPLSTSLLLHYDDQQVDHDENGDGFMEMPKVRQWNGMWRTAYVSSKWISQLFVRGLREERESGMSHKHAPNTNIEHYYIGVNTNRYEAQWKNALILDPAHSTSVALMLHGSYHDASSTIGHALYDVTQKNGYAQLMFETDLTPAHNLSIGASLNHDNFDENLIGKQIYNARQTTGTVSSYSRLWDEAVYSPCNETVYGLYGQYTYKQDELFTLIAGLRWDHSNYYGGFWTPRLHLKYSPAEWLTLRASAGKGYRSPHIFAENFSLLASGKQFCFDFENDKIDQEEAWNYGISASTLIPLGDEELSLNAEYYYTDFQKQLVIDPYSHSGEFRFYNLDGQSYSHTIQVDATYPLFSGFDVTAGIRFSDVKTTYQDQLRWRPLTAEYKGMLSLAYKTPLEFWQFDVTGQVIGPQRLYNGDRTKPYGMLQAQITREFRLFSLYIGGENLTDYTIDRPIIGASDPWSSAFDATQVWGPMDGIMFYVGMRFKFERD